MMFCYLNVHFQGQRVNGFILNKCKEKSEAVCVLNLESHHIKPFGGLEFLFHALLTSDLDKGFYVHYLIITNYHKY